MTVDRQTAIDHYLRIDAKPASKFAVKLPGQEGHMPPCEELQFFSSQMTMKDMASYYVVTVQTVSRWLILCRKRAASAEGGDAI